MATKTFCDVCGEECPASRTQLMAIAVSVVDLGDVCTTCRTEAMIALIEWRRKRMETKKEFRVVEREIPVPAPEPEPAVIEPASAPAEPAPEPEPSAAPLGGEIPS